MKFVAQYDQMDCGPACLSMVASHYKKDYSLRYLRDNSFITREGVSVLGIRKAGEKVGFKGKSLKTDVESLKKLKPYLPAILHWEQNHFVVLKKITKNIFTKRDKYHIADPAYGSITLEEEEFCKNWISSQNKGIALFLHPTKEFYLKEEVKDKKNSFSDLIQHLVPFKKEIIYLFIILLFGSAISMVFPFLTQYLIDRGIKNKDINFISLILFSQLALFLGSITIEILRNRILLYMGTKISINIISDFLKRLLKLPLSFFDTRLIGDFRQRIQDNKRIEIFLTSDSLLTFFSILTLSVLMGVLFYYDYKILLIYLFLSTVSVLWSIYWLKKRKYLDYFMFQENSKNQESLYEILNGVTELKINQYEDYKRKKWEEVQKKLFNIKIRILKLEQLQVSGFQFINQIKNILVTFLAAIYVVYNKLTLGELLSVSYIIGQMNSPVNQILNFIRGLQDSKLSLERINEIHQYPPEDKDLDEKKININKSIKIDNLSFKYDGAASLFTLKNINLEIPKGKVTAIVGSSGSGKTTLIKLLMKFYSPLEGNIYYDEMNLKKISSKNLRENLGAVMQDGFIFSDSILRNIITKDEKIDKERLKTALEVSNIEDFVSSLPLGLETKIGASGNGISGGQKQRILIARVVYKNPDFIFFDEATSFLDAKNEKIIHENLNNFFNNKTVVIVAHRLSTVKNADQIIVIERGEILETGTHKDLVGNKSIYFNLIKNQLELGEG